MKHFVLTRASYGSNWSLDANRRRLAITKAVTAPLMAAQTNRDWAWVVLFDRDDPLLDERQAVFSDAAPTFIPMLWTPPPKPLAARWDKHGAGASLGQRVAATAYKQPWRDAFGIGDERVMQTRLDDDDGLAPNAIARYRKASARVMKRTILMLPKGIRVWKGRYTDVTHNRNAMHSLITPAGDTTCIYAYGHASCHRAAPVTMVDSEWGWIWVRHQDTISGHRIAAAPITRRERAYFPIDWVALQKSWA